MRKRKAWWQQGLSPAVCEELEHWLRVVLTVGAALLLLAALRAQLARAADFPSSVGAGTLLFETAGGGFDHAAPLSTDLRVSVAGVVARVRVAQRFRNPGASFVEAVYVLPLPHDAAVDRLLMQIGERVVEGEIHERVQAERVYAAARTAGQRTSLVRQTSANLFTTAVANIPPGESIDITIEYLQTARYDAGEFSVRIPMTLTPRYGTPDTPEALDARLSPVLPEPLVTIDSVLAAAASSTPRHEATVHAVLAPGMPLASVDARGHEMRVTRERDGGWSVAQAKPSSGAGTDTAGVLVTPPAAELYVLDTVAPRVPMDRDVVIAWRPQVGVAPAVAALTETRGDTTYALLMILPPASAHVGRSQPREQILVIDTSGSMAGESLVQAKAALKDALGRLTSADRFNVLQFNSYTSSLFQAPVPFDARNYALALRYVDGLAANGGTEIGAAIQAALAQAAAAGYLRQVVFITDGAVSSETVLFQTIASKLGDARLFTIGIGSAPNSLFMRKAAQFGRGTYTHIDSPSEVAEKMQALNAKLERVALSDVLVDWPEAVELYPHEIPDVYAGEPLVVAASYPARPDRPLLTTAFGRAGGLPWKQTVAGVPSELPGIATLWARRKIEHLIDSRVAGTDEALIRKLVIDTALEHHLVSPYTSLVAVDKTPLRAAGVPLSRHDVANAPPAGSQWQAALPRTATPAPLLRLVGALVLLLVTAVAFGGRIAAFAAAVARRPS
jgi:Ca-activated chloride channel family protein